MTHNSQQSLLILLMAILLVLHAQKGETREPFACDPNNDTTKNLPFCNVSLVVEDRVKDLIGQLTLQEKIKLLVNTASPVDRLGIKGYEWWSEALHGVSNTGLGVKFGGKFPSATSFPQVITSAASFNASLWEAIGQAVSSEARAMYNGGVAGLTYWSPNINIFRDPRWGRGQETPGEDPMLTSKYAVSYVKGLQGNDAGNNLKVAACCKHYTAYDLENWNGVDRYHFNAKVSKQDLEETYNVPFKACVEEGRVASVMCSYNQVNGKPTCADPNLLLDTIRGQWNLNGYIVSDCDSIRFLYERQHFTTTPEDAVAFAIKAGLDLECGTFLAEHSEGAIKNGKLNEADVNGALVNILMVQMRLGMFDGPNQTYDLLGPNDVCTSAHQELALEAARQGIVLVQNRDRALPFSASRYRILAVIGPNSDATVAMIGNYAGTPCGYTSPLQGISRYIKTIHERGCLFVNCTDNEQFGKAEAAAREADATVLVMGLGQDFEAEFIDRIGLLLPGHQQELVSRVANASRGPVVLVLMSGGPIDVTFAKNDPKIASIIWVGYPGQAGGTAIGDVLFGTTNPGGKLPMTWYPQDYVDKLPMTDMAMRPDPSRGYAGRTYRFYEGPVVFSFGFGLSYTNFRISLVHAPSIILLPFDSPKISKNSSMSTNTMRVSHANCDSLTLGLHIDVENTGELDGTHTLLVFAATTSVNKSEEKKRLITFEKTYIPIGTKKRVKISVNTCKHLSMVDRFGIRRIPMVEHNLHIGDLKHIITFQNAMQEIKPP